MKILYIIPFVLFGCAQSADLATVNARIDSLNSRIVEVENRIIELNAANDSLHYQVVGLARTNIYLDSLVAAKQGKVERAERRGRFVGGLLKTLIPGL